MDSTATALTDAEPFLQSALYHFKSFQLNSDVIFYVALAIGFFIIGISYFFGGGKTNRLKVMISIVIGTIIGILTLPLLLKIVDATNAKPIVVTILLVIDLIFTSAVTCHLYELVVVRASEAFSGKDS